MAMDDVYKLVEAVLVHACMVNPQRDGIVLDFKKPYPTADVLSATVHMNHRTCDFEGSVRFQIRGEGHCHVESFYNLWLAGWTLPLSEWPQTRYRDAMKHARYELRQRSAASPKKKRRARS